MSANHGRFKGLRSENERDVRMRLTGIAMDHLNLIGLAPSYPQTVWRLMRKGFSRRHIPWVRKLPYRI